MAARRSRKTRRTARKTRKTARKTRKTARKTRRKILKKAKKRPAKRKRSTQSSNVKHNTDIGTLSLTPHFNAKRRAQQDELKKYEQKYLARYKQPKSGISKSKSWKQSEVNLGKLSLTPHFNAKRKAQQDEIKKYEQKYLARYKEPKSVKSSNVKHDTDIGTLSLTPHFNAKRRASNHLM